MNKNLYSSIEGCLLGAAVGDAIGLPWEAIHPKKIVIEKIDRYHFFFNKGMCSDDTEHLCIVARALVQAKGDIHLFQRILGWELRLWLLAIPAGIGWATLRSIIKLCIGFSPKNSGVFSAGNGPSMRSSIIGVLYGDMPQKLHQFVKAATVVTHTDIKAELGALTVAIAAYLSKEDKVNCEDMWKQISYYCDAFYTDKQTSEYISIIKTTLSYVKEKSLVDLIEHLSLQKGVSGYIYHTLPVVLFLWLKYPQDYRAAIEKVIMCGGDTDTTASILGGIIGAHVGGENIPYLDNLIEWPHGVKWIKSLAKDINDNQIKTKKANFLILFSRNLFFTTIVLIHGFSRIFRI